VVTTVVAAIVILPAPTFPTFPTFPLIRTPQLSPHLDTGFIFVM
jgi:hypothetical protein